MSADQRLRRPRGSTAPSRSAATGAIRVARRAGAMDARTVVPTPIRRPITIALAGMVAPASGSLSPTELNTEPSPAATR